MVNTTNELIVSDYVKKIGASLSRQIKIEKIIEEMKVVLIEDGEKSKDDFYTLEVLEGMENQSYAFMVREIPNLILKRNRPFKSRPHSRSFNNNKGKNPKRFMKGCLKS